MNEEIKVLAQMLFDKYKTLTLTEEELSDAVHRSKVSLARDRMKARGIPYTKLGAGNGSDKSLYSVYDVAKFIVSRKTKVMS